MKFNFDKYNNRYETNSTKWNKYNNQVIPLWIADSDFKSPPCIIHALKKRIQHGIFGYSDVPKRLIDSIIQRMENLYNWNIQPEWIVLLPGVVSGLNICVRAFTNEKELIIFPKPIYPPFIYASKNINRNYLQIPLNIENKRWLMNITEEILQTKKNKKKLLMLCNPQNPGGTVYRKEELKKQLYIANKYDLIVCSDEVHCDLILEPKLKHIPFANLGEDALQRTITLMSPSKTFNIAGLNIAFAIIANKKLRDNFKKIKKDIVPEVNILAMEAATAAFNEGEDWLKEQIKYLRENRNLLISKLFEINKSFIIAPPEGTYLAWININFLNLKNPLKWFEKYGLGISPGEDFGDKNFIRINFACTRSLLNQAINRIKIAISDNYKNF